MLLRFKKVAFVRAAIRSQLELVVELRSAISFNLEQNIQMLWD